MPRIHIEGGLYFVTTKGDHSGELFKDDQDRTQYLELLSRYKKEYKFKLYSYVLMPAFVHLLIEPGPETTISDIMHVINSTYTKYFNGRYDRSGHLFQGRFKASLVERAAYLTELTRYIHLVPVMARLAEKPEEYKWSSYQGYVGMEEDVLGMAGSAKEVLDTFSPDRVEQLKLYSEFVYSVEADKMEALKKKIQTSWIIGSKIFTEGIKKKLKEDAKREEREKQKAWVEGRPHKIFLIAGSISILVLLLVALYLYRAKLGFESELERKEREFLGQLEEEQKKLKKDLGEKYRADMVSYGAMQKRLEAEKKKAKEMEKKMEELKAKKEK